MTRRMHVRCAQPAGSAVVVPVRRPEPFDERLAVPALQFAPCSAFAPRPEPPNGSPGLLPDPYEADDAKSVNSAAIRRASPRYRISLPVEVTPIPVVAHMICHSCGAHGQAPVRLTVAAASHCRCGGVRQVVRIVRHPRGAASTCPEALERNVQARAGDETLTPSDKRH